MVKVSVVVPVYNVEKYLAKCLQSLIGQTLKDIEIVVVNDGSADGSQKIADEFKERYPEIIKCVVKENGGVGSARNAGLERASGEYIAFIDSDDYVKADMLERLYDSAKKHDSDVAIGGNIYVDENGDVLREEIFSYGKECFNADETRDVLLSSIGVCNKIYRADFLRKIGAKFRVQKWYEDFDFIIKVLLSAQRISVVEDAFYYYLQRQGSIMNNSNLIRNLEILEALSETLKFCKERNLLEKYYDEIEFLALLHAYSAASVRIINADADKKDKLLALEEIKSYMDKEFKDFKNNKYIGSHLSRNKKIVMRLLDLKLYTLIGLMFKAKRVLAR